MADEMGLGKTVGTGGVKKYVSALRADFWRSSNALL
jgi:hypothetical protein